jgi:hypothetical protein
MYGYGLQFTIADPAHRRQANAKSHCVQYSRDLIEIELIPYTYI